MVMAYIVQKQDMFGNNIDCLVAQEEQNATFFADGMIANGESRVQIINR